MLTATLTGYIATYGYLAVFAAVAMESAGVPVPGETTLIAAGVVAGTTHRLSVVGIVVVAAVAAILGDNAGYLIGAKGGAALIRRLRSRLPVTDAALEAGQRLFARHGGKVVFAGRFVSVLRTYAAVLAGLNRMSWRRFALCNAAGGALWAVAFGIGSYELGHTISRVGTVVSVVVGAVVVCAALVGLVLGRRYAARLLRPAPDPGAVIPSSGSPGYK